MHSQRLKQPVVLLAFPAILLGGASAWPIIAAYNVVQAVLFSAFFLAVLIVFGIVLPKRLGLPMQIFIAMLAGAVCGRLLADAAQGRLISDYLGIFGALFILLLKLVIVPLIFVSIVCGAAGIGDFRKLGVIGAKTVLYYLFTSALAVLIGLVLVNAVRPGAVAQTLQVVEQEAADDGPDTFGMRIQKEVLPAVIQNPIMAGQNPIAVIFFALVLGVALAGLGESGDPAVRVFRAFDKAFIQIILWIMAMAPIGVFALMARALSELGVSYILTLGKYCFTVLAGLSIHFCLLVFGLIPIVARISPWRFLRGMAPALEVAFTTSSSSATLPVSLDCVTRRVGADHNISHFMLPIGATINMDGTALYVAVAAVFVAQVYGIPLNFAAQFSIFVTAILVSIGTAGIPGASIGLMGIVFHSAGIPVEGIGIILGVDRFLDMCRTVVNMTGDSVGAVVVSRTEGLLQTPAPHETKH